MSCFAYSSRDGFAWIWATHLNTLGEGHDQSGLRFIAKEEHGKKKHTQTERMVEIGRKSMDEKHGDQHSDHACPKPPGKTLPFCHSVGERPEHPQKTCHAQKAHLHPQVQPAPLKLVGRPCAVRSDGSRPRVIRHKGELFSKTVAQDGSFENGL